MKKKLAILLFEQVEVLDFAGPFEVFSVANELHNFALWEVFTVSHSGKAISAVNGLKVLPDYAFSGEADFQSCPTDIDYLVIPGGDGSKLYFQSPAYQKWIEQTYQTAEKVLTICSGSRFLAPLGLLNGKNYCTHQDVYPSLKQLAPQGIPQPNLRFVKDGKLTSAGGISSGIDASFAVLADIAGEKVCDTTAKYMEYFRNPADCGGYWR